MRIPNVPHEVPVAKARPAAIMKIIAGRKFLNEEALSLTRPATNSFALRLSVIPLRVHARVRIKIAGTIDLNPSTIQFIEDSNVMIFLIR